MRALFFAVWLVAGCKTSHVLDAASHTDAASAAQIETQEHKEYGPEHITMTVEEFSQLCDPAQPPGGSPAKEGASTQGTAGLVTGASGPKAFSVQGGQNTSAPALPQLIRRTVTVTDRGPSLDDLRTISSLQSKLNSATEIKTKDESKPGGIFGLWWLVGLLPLVAGVLVWKLKPSLFGVAFGALKGLLK